MTSARAFKKVGMVVNPRKAGACALLTKIKTWLQKRGVRVWDTLSGASVQDMLEKASFMICLGGDGTLLSLAGQMKRESVPILGVNLGSLGFLTEVKQSEVFEELERCLEGKADIENRMMLACRARGRKSRSVERRFIALNDIVIGREGLSRILRLEVRVNDEILTNFSGDGVIIATPTGSTAYSLSAGGAVVLPTLKALIITPVCPHTSSLRPIVVSSREKVTVRLLADRGPAKALVTVDGQENLEIDDSFIIEARHYPVPLRLVKSSRRSYFATLRENFKFPQ